MKDQKQFISTRGNAESATAPEAVLRGLASDGGLYTLRDVPRIDPAELIHLDFCGMAKRILGAYMAGYPQANIDACVDAAYAGKFDDPCIAPLCAVGDRYMLELFHGPTAAFKDVALSLLPQLTSAAMRLTKFDREILILTATSGDTGSAAMKGFQNVEGVRIIAFYPDRGISPIQRAQMTTMSGSNVCACAVSDNFDAAQTGVKRIFSEISPEFCAENHVALSSANSINFGRLAPQIVYYYSAYLDLVRNGRIQMGDPVNFCVPTGNFGDILAGWYARRSGLPIDQLICASNENNVLTDFFRTGVYDKRREFHVTASPSMDILISSNLERLLFEMLDYDAQAVRDRMEALKNEGFYTMPDAAMEKLRARFSAYCVSDERAFAAIRKTLMETGYLMDPHTAVAWQAAEDYRAQTGDVRPCVVLSTASPYKFPVSVLTALGEAVPENVRDQIAALERVSGTRAPESIRGVLGSPVRFTDVIDPKDMMTYVMGKAANR